MCTYIREEILAVAPGAVAYVAKQYAEKVKMVILTFTMADFGHGSYKIFA